MERVLTSRWFLASTAACCGLTVAFVLWAVGDVSGGARALAGSIGLVASLGVMLLIAWALTDETAAAPVALPIAEPLAVVPAAAPPLPVEPDVLAQRLDEGRGLREAVAPGSTDPRVDSWIDDVRAAIEGRRPGLAGYFNALGQRVYADDRLRLDAYTRRLETIVRGY